MRRASYAEMQCSVARALDIVGDPWTLLIVRDLFRGLHRFDEFADSLGIARNTLASRLATLVDADVIEKREYQSNPPRYAYHLTEKGRSFQSVIIALLEWGDRWAGFDEPPVVLIDTDRDERVEPMLVDRRTGRELSDMNVRPVDNR